MQLEGMEFITRFSQHILPKGFVRIRHYGILSSSSKGSSGEKIKAQLSAIKIPAYIKPKAKPAPYNPKQCPCCKKETMETLLYFSDRPPPAYILEQLAKDTQAMVS